MASPGDMYVTASNGTTELVYTYAPCSDGSSLSGYWTEASTSVTTPSTAELSIAAYSTGTGKVTWGGTFVGSTWGSTPRVKLGGRDLLLEWDHRDQCWIAAYPRPDAVAECPT